MENLYVVGTYLGKMIFFRKSVFKKVEIIDHLKDYAVKRKDAFIKSIESGRRTISECINITD